MVKSTLKRCALYGLVSGGIATAFTLISILVPIERQAWLRLFDLNGILMFGVCIVIALKAGRETGRIGPAIVSSSAVAVIGSLIYTVAELVAPYALFRWLVHYPFLHEDFVHSGIPTIQEYLLSDKGYSGVVGTTLGILPFVLAFAVLLGTALGWVGGWYGTSARMRRSGQFS